MGAGAGSANDRVERFRLVYDAAHPRITAYALRRARTRDDAHDAISETFMTVWRRLDDVPEGPQSLPWIYGVARRVLANQYRSAGRRERLPERVGTVAEPADDPDFGFVHDALGRLRTDDREILTLSVWDGLSNDEIAAVFGIRPAAVAVRLHRARERFASRLGARTVKSANSSRTLPVVYGTQPGPGEVDPE
jgi:RNA polymerase sigma factor (sigma-70 family)